MRTHRFTQYNGAGLLDGTEGNGLFTEIKNVFPNGFTIVRYDFTSPGGSTFVFSVDGPAGDIPVQSETIDGDVWHTSDVHIACARGEVPKITYTAGGATTKATIYVQEP